jgi:hypothetical protein
MAVAAGPMKMMLWCASVAGSFGFSDAWPQPWEGKATSQPVAL